MAAWNPLNDKHHPERMYCLVAVEEDRLVGLAHYLFHRSTTRTADVCYLQDLFTAEDRRGSHDKVAEHSGFIVYVHGRTHG